MKINGLAVTLAPGDLTPVQATIPLDYAMNLNLAAPGITGIVSEQQANGEDWFDALARLLPIVGATYQQKQMLDAQADRARLGLPPLDVSQYAPGAAVKFSLDPALQKMILLGGVAAVGLFLYTRKKGR